MNVYCNQFQVSASQKFQRFMIYVHAKGMIVDDEINETIVRPLPEGAMLHAIIDACYSGTILDLPFVCKMNR